MLPEPVMMPPVRPVGPVGLLSPENPLLSAPTNCDLPFRSRTPPGLRVSELPSLVPLLALVISPIALLAPSLMVPSLIYTDPP